MERSIDPGSAMRPSGSCLRRVVRAKARQQHIDHRRREVCILTARRRERDRRDGLRSLARVDSDDDAVPFPGCTGAVPSVSAGGLAEEMGRDLRRNLRPLRRLHSKYPARQLA